MVKKRNQYTLTDRILNAAFSSKTIYGMLVITLILLYPVAVIDGQRWTFVEEVGVRLPLKYKTHGIDISHHNGKVNWEKVSSFSEHHSAVRFCFLKATEGTDLIDQEFDYNWNKLGETNILRGAYHYFNPTSDPRLQALNFILNVNLEEGDIVPVLDFEDNAKTNAGRKKLAENVKVWLDTIEKHYGVKPIIYTNKYIYNTYVKEYFKGYPLWISQYEAKELEGYEMDDVYFWQHTMHGRVEGISSAVDFNAFVGDDYDIEKLLIRSRLKE